jgi:hypothetical protein
MPLSVTRGLPGNLFQNATLGCSTSEWLPSDHLSQMASSGFQLLVFCSLDLADDASRVCVWIGLVSCKRRRDWSGRLLVKSVMATPRTAEAAHPRARAVQKCAKSDARLGLPRPAGAAVPRAVVHHQNAAGGGRLRRARRPLRRRGAELKHRVAARHAPAARRSAKAAGVRARAL